MFSVEIWGLEVAHTTHSLTSTDPQYMPLTLFKVHVFCKDCSASAVLQMY